MKELIEEIMNHCDGIIERSERMTSGNYMHNCAANKFSAKIIKSCVNNLVSGIHWQTGELKESGIYLVTTSSNIVRTSYWNNGCWLINDLPFSTLKIKAWCKLSDIKPYKEDE